MLAVNKSSQPLGEEAALLRKEIINALYQCGGGHYGGSLSVLDIILVLYRHFIRTSIQEPRHPQRDRFILSKGHAAIAYYAVLQKIGFIQSPLAGYGQVQSPYQGHPDMTAMPGIDFSTGSLGQGLSAGLGMALALRAANINTLSGKESDTTALDVNGKDSDTLKRDVHGKESDKAEWNLSEKQSNTTAFDINGTDSDTPKRDVHGKEPDTAKWKVSEKQSNTTAFDINGKESDTAAWSINGKESGIKEYNVNGSDVNPPKVWVILGDGECQEGQVWEAAMMAHRYKVDNLCAIVDYNKYQEWGWNHGKNIPTDPVIDIAQKWSAFGWNVLEANGHDHEEMIKIFTEAAAVKGKPSVVIAHTIKGKGYPLIEADPLRFHCSSVEPAEQAKLENLPC